jgi:RNA polymerase sigma-70 factor (ECF subfamily)
LYGELEKLEPESLQIKINRIIAESYFTEPHTTINKLNNLDPGHNDNLKYLLKITKAELLRRWGLRQEAATVFSEALKLAGSPVDISYIKRRSEQCSG